MSKNIERYAPTVIGTLLACWSFFYLKGFLVATELKQVEIENVFGPIFDLATFSAGILFTIYFLALGPGGGFIERIFRTQTFAIFHRYVAVSIVFNCLLAGLSIHYVIVGVPSLETGFEVFLASAWMFLLGAAIVSLGRVMAVFLILVGAEATLKSRKRIGQAS
jgi:hypothetical protein